MDSNILNRSSLSDQIIDKLKSDPSTKDIYTFYQNGGRCDGWVCNPSAVDEFSKKLAEKGISHACVQGAKDVLFISKEEDREKIRGLRNQYLKQTQTLSELSLDQLKVNHVGEDIHSVRGVSEAYASIFKEEATNLKMQYAITDNRDGTRDIHFLGKDRNKANSAIMNTIVATRGVIGKFKTEKAISEMSREKDLYQNISNPQREFYVVSHTQPNKYMHFNSVGYEHYQNGNCIGSEHRINKNFEIDAYKKIDSSFTKPVVLTKEEFEEVRKLSKEQYREQISKKHILAKPDSHELHKMELERMAKQIAEYKMSLDNNELNSDFYNRNISVAGFEKNEVITDDRISKETEMSISNPKAMPPEVTKTIDKQQSLPMEDREYVDERVKEYIDEVRKVSRDIEIVEITRESVNENIDIMIASLASERTVSETMELSTEVSLERD